MWMYGPGVSAASSPTTWSMKVYVRSSGTHSELKPTLVPVYSRGALPLQLSCA